MQSCAEDVSDNSSPHLFYIDQQTRQSHTDIAVQYDLSCSNYIDH